MLVENESSALDLIRPFQTDAPVPVIEVARSLGVNVWSSGKFSGHVSGKLIRDPRHGGESGYSIIVNASQPATRSRFTIAHQLAHFLLHREEVGSELVDDTFYRSKLNDRLEVEANRVAAEILMPGHLLSRLIRSGIVDVQELAKRFQVSEPAMKVRLGIPVV